MKTETRLKISIKSLSHFGVASEIIQDMENDLAKLISEMKSERIAKDHFRKQRDAGLIELKEIDAPTY